jgi:hypothetical protein
MTFGYNFNVPNAPNDPSDDQPQMLINTVSIGNLIAVDHVGFNNANGGYHTVIHQGNAPSNMDPGKIADIGQLYVKTITFNSVMDQQLFFESGNGIISQLTTGITPLVAANGYSYIAGGVIVQWGQTTANNNPLGRVVLFSAANINFPNNIFFISASPTAGGGVGTFYVTGNVSKTGFTLFTTGFSTGTPFSWFAIGN